MKLTKMVLALVGGLTLTLLAVSLTFAAPDNTLTQSQHNLFEPTITPTVTLTPTITHTQPVAQAIAVYSHIPYTEVVSLHDSGLGYGRIARAYLPALASGGSLTPTGVLELIQSGLGWGQIKHQYGIHPGGLGLGSIMSGHAAPVTSTLGSGAGYANPSVKESPGKSKNSNSSPCPGNSCNAPGQQNKPGKGKK